MMSMQRKIIKELGKTNNLLVKGMFTYILPSYFVKANQKNQRSIGFLGKISSKSVFTLSFDIDYKEDLDALPYLLEKLKKYNIKASFAVVGKLVEIYPKEHISIVKAGHEIINHSYVHPHHEIFCKDRRFFELTKKEIYDDIKKCHDICKRTLGITPIGYRLPHFGNGELIKKLDLNDLYGALKKLGYKYSSSTIGVKTGHFGSPFVSQNGLLEFPLSPCPKHPFGVLDTYHSFRAENASHKKKGEFYGLFSELMNFGIKEKSYINVYFDPQDIKNDEFDNILMFLQRKRSKIDIYNYSEMLNKMNKSKNDMENKIKERFNELDLVVLDKISRKDFRINYIRKQVKDFKGKRVLDVGCGKGAMVRIFKEFGAKVYGIDISDKILEKAQNRIDDVEFKEGSATDIPYKKEFFDVVVSSEVIEHVPNTSKAIEEMVRVLKPGGKLIVIDKNKYALHYKMWFMLNLMYSKLKNPKQKGVAMYPKGFGFKEKWFSEKDVKKMLKKYCHKVKSKNLNMKRIGLFIGWTGVK